MMNENSFMEGLFEVIGHRKYKNIGMDQIKDSLKGLRLGITYSNVDFDSISIHNDDTGEEWKLEIRKVYR